MITIEEFKKKQLNTSRLIGLDLGSKRIGVAICDEKANKLKCDLNNIFEFIEKLNELNTDNVQALTSIAETTLRFRKDEVKSENIREKIFGFQFHPESFLTKNGKTIIKKILSA